MMNFITTYLSSLAAILTILTSLVATSKLLRRLWERNFIAKPRDKVVNQAFNYYDVQAGVSALVDYARLLNPDILVGINRGGAIVGGILGKHLGKLVYTIEVHRERGEVKFERPIECICGKKILLVDDRLSTGNNMEAAYKVLRQHAQEVRCMVFACLQDAMVARRLDAFGYKVAARGIPLPWEPGAAREW